MKKVLIAIVFFLAMAGAVQAGGRVTKASGTFSAIPETTYFPSETYGIDMKDFNSWGYKFYVTTVDTTFASDSIFVTSQMSDTRQCSSTINVFHEGTKDDATIDTITRWMRADTLDSGMKWIERYMRLMIITHAQTVAYRDTCLPDSDFVDDWSASHAESTYYAVDETFGATDTTGEGGYVFVTDKDSVQAWSVTDDAIGKGHIDSVTISVLAVEADSLLGVTTSDHCSLAIAICQEDTANCSWRATTAVRIDTAYGRYTHVAAVSPSTGIAWTAADLNDLMIAIESIYVDTLAAGGQDTIQVFQATALVYWDNDTYFITNRPTWKIRFIGRE